MEFLPDNVVPCQILVQITKRFLWLSALSLIAWNTNFATHVQELMCPSKQRYLAS